MLQCYNATVCNTAPYCLLFIEYYSLNMLSRCLLNQPKLNIMYNTNDIIHFKGGCNNHTCMLKLRSCPPCYVTGNAFVPHMHATATCTMNNQLLPYE